MPNLDRFSQPMSWEWNRRPDLFHDLEPEVEYEEPVLCACGCKEQIWLEDVDSYVECPDWEDTYYALGHLEKSKRKDLLVGSKSL